MAAGLTTVGQTDYPSLFRTYVRRSAEHVLRRVRQTAVSVPPAEREQAVHTLGYVLNLPEAWSLTRDLLLALAPAMEQAGYREGWLAYLQRGIEQSRRFKDAATEADLQFHLGVLHQRQARFDEARAAFQSSAAGFARLGRRDGEARALNRLAYVARLAREHEEAQRLVDAALARGGGDISERAYSYLVLGTLAYDRRDWQTARDLFQQSLDLWETTGNQRLMAWGLTNLGTAHWGLKQYDAAIGTYRRAIDLFEMVHDPLHEAGTRMNLGNVYLQLDRYADALELYQAAEPVFRRAHSQVNLAMLHNNMGMGHHRLGQWDRARRAYQASIERWRALGNVSDMVNVMDNLGELDLDLGRYEEAAATFRAALDALAEIENDPSYEHLRAMVAGHLEKALQFL